MRLALEVLTFMAPDPKYQGVEHFRCGIRNPEASTATSQPATKKQEPAGTQKQQVTHGFCESTRD